MTLSSSLSSEPKMRRRYYLKKDNVCTYLTEAEVCCLRHLLQGRSYQETAKLLKLSTRTIEFYSQNIQAKLICHNRESLIEFFRNYMSENPLSWL